ncbi:transcriptional regulatory protein ZraR [Peptococcaceae bacterium CEB3]|nr:transcriptional regulatory protein ZraR [Peptococcaceae bacterium CEB3]
MKTPEKFRHFTNLMNEIRAVLDAIYTAVIAVDMAGNISFINKAAERFVGSAEEVLGQPINKIIPETKLMEVVRTGQPQFGRRLRIGDKAVITNRTPIFIDGKVSGAVGAFLDITDLETTAAELRTVQEINTELNALIDSSADGLVICNNDGILLRMNEAYQNMVDIPKGVAEGLIGKPVMELVRQGYLSELVTSSAMETKRTATMMQEIRGREILFTGTPVLDQNNRLVRVIANIRDLTELNSTRKKLQEATREVARYKSEISRLKIKALEEGFVFNSPEMQKLLDLTLRVAKVDTSVLITGESGVGKEVFARIIHEASKRPNKPFIKVNCGAFAPTLIESELFGYEQGAFTGATRKGKPGIFELASGGTLLLDEVGELPLDLQVKLLRVIQEQEITRLGGTASIPVDVRIISATNQDLEALVNEGRFRKDLFFRLNVVNIKIPPLREHVTDIPYLAERFMRHFCQKHNLNRKLTTQLLQKLVEYKWPGNIRELQNTLERLVIFSPREEIDSALFTPASSTESEQVFSGTLRSALAETEKKVIIQAYNVCGSSRKAAALLGIDQSTVVRKLQQYRKEGGTDADEHQ